MEILTGSRKTPLPEGWRWVKLGDACRVVNGTTPKSGVQEYWGGDIVWVTPTDLGRLDLPYIKGSERRITNEGFESGNLEIVPAGSVVLSSRAPIGHLGIASVPLCTNQGCKSFVLGEGIDSDFLFFALKDSVSEIQQLGSGATFTEVSKTQLEKFEIPVSPLPEQKRIAAILRERMDAVERARKSAEEQLEAAQALMHSHLRQIFEGKEAQQWRKIIFESVAILQRGYDLPIQNRTPGQYPVMTSSGENGNNHECMAKAPGVITGRSGSIGNVYYIEKDYWPHNTALFVKDFQGNYPRYIFFLLQWIDLKSIANATGVPTLDRKSVHKVRVPHPDLAKQKEISDYLSGKFYDVEILKDKVESQLTTINTLPGALLRQAFRGEL
ncbi:MAG: restriction endonuclease subunit S [Deltaproteobacteria bacterium]|nr:restriction endonuclease subunit S [Deltaproteobacteria bacterium]